MAFAGQTLPEILGIYPQYGQNTRPNPHHPNLDNLSTCKQCIEYSVFIIKLQSRIASLTDRNDRLEKEKAEANIVIQYLLQLKVNATGPKHEDSTSERVGRAAFLNSPQPPTKKESKTGMLRLALETMVQLSTMIRGNTVKQNLCSGGHDDIRTTENLLPDLTLSSHVLPAIETDDTQQESDEDSERNLLEFSPGAPSEKKHTVRFIDSPRSKTANSDHETMTPNSSCPIVTALGESRLNSTGESDNSSTVVNSMNQSFTDSEAPAADAEINCGRAKIEEDTAYVLIKGDTSLVMEKPLFSQLLQTPTQAYDAEKIETRKELFDSNQPPLVSSCSHEKYKRAINLPEQDYDVRYMPLPGTANLFRTIIISGLPAEANLAAVLKQVYGGIIIDSKILDTVSITGTKTAWLTFSDEATAVAFEAHVKTHPLKILNCPVQVTVIKTPSWPCSPNEREAIDQGNRTRCLTVGHFPLAISPKILTQDLKIGPFELTNGVEIMEMQANDSLSLRFSSVMNAERAFSILISNPKYRECTVQFAPDPCAKPLASPPTARAV